jgi:deazaflavin-dependent oxidoreductase (nitroreductase family)
MGRVGALGTLNGLQCREAGVRSWTALWGGTTAEQENELMERHVRQLGQQWAAAALHGDTPVLERTPADDVVGIRPRGFLLPKEQWLAECRSGGRTTLKIVGTLHRLLYRWSAGRVGGTLRGGPVLLLTTTGRTTGRAHTWPLCYLVAGDELVVVASARGAPSHPAWYLNLQADGRVSVQRGGRTQMMVARTVHGAERARLWERVVQQYSVCAAYQRQTGREMPVVLLRSAAPVGSHVPAREDGTNEP